MRFVLLAAAAAVALGAEVIEPNCPRTWTYAEADQWGSMCSAWAQCSAPMQSPIDIATPMRVGAPSSMAHSMHYLPVTSVKMFNTGRAIKVPIDKVVAGDGVAVPNRANTLCVADEVYYLREVHFHSPSEHRIDGVEYDLEVQYVHDSFYNDEHAVVSVFFNKGKHSWWLDQLFFDLPEFDHCWCGNGRLEPWTGEECDNGAFNNNTNPDACREDCTLPRCGDGVTDNCEQCDDGPLNQARSNHCRPGTCVLPACGDGILDQVVDDVGVISGEQCDDGNRHNLDGCSSICHLECGDGYNNTDVRIDPDNGPDAGSCTPQDYGTPNCTGLNFPVGVEECDDGFASLLEPNGCRERCLDFFCGDGVTDFNEQCDYGPLSAAEADTTPDSCRSACVAPSCGDGVVDSDEECDFTINDDTTGCNATCYSMCGDGIIQDALVGAGGPGEACDEGDENSQAENAYCRVGCTLAYCGDRILDDAPADLDSDGTPDREPEMCDEGELRGNGGNGFPLHPDYSTTWCNAACQVECGNGRIDGPAENCDNTGEDNQLASGICRPWCRLAFCGDGITDAGLEEECDDGPSGSSVCTATCQLPFCGDSSTDATFGEECDDGNADNDDGCNNDCRLNCGNSIIDVGEQCDDGGAMNSNTAADACRSTSSRGRCVKSFCGDGVTDTGEACDDGEAGSASCRADCTIPYCGDGIRDANFGEECDDGDLNSDVRFFFDDVDVAHGCSTDCILNRCRVNEKPFPDAPFEWDMSFPMHNHSALCYRGSLTEPPCTADVKWVVFEEPQEMSVLQYAQIRSVLPHVGSPHEGNAAHRPLQPVAGRQVSFCNDVAAQPMAKCGNGFMDAGEECDMGLRNSDAQSDACRTNCLNPRCGDGVIDAGLGEECEPPSSNGCSDSCHVPRILVNDMDHIGWSYKRSGDWWMRWESCDGDMQSPINLVRDHTRDVGDARTTALDGVFNYVSEPRIEIYNTVNLPVWKITYGGSAVPNTLTWAGVTYTLSEITVHSPSEHTIEGRSADLEVQFHHHFGDQSASVAVLYDSAAASACNKFLNEFWFYLPAFTHQMCGNGKVETLLAGGAEACDDGDMNSDFKPNACRTDCSLPRCGDGVVDRGEQCDDGLLNDDTRPGACRATDCIWPYCGDGIVDPGEGCDDGNNEDRDGCDKKCRSECGDGNTDGDEQCDNGPANSHLPDACRPSCAFARCGDGIVDSDEECDLGDGKNGDMPNACRADCTLPRCNDGVTDPAFGEECDRGAENDDELSTCTSECKWNCGNGVINTQIVDDPTAPVPVPMAEECDDGSAMSWANSNCRPTCRLPRCGDGVIDNGAYGTRVFTEACDDGEGNFERCCPTGNPLDASCACPNARCFSCQIRCGDGITDPGEGCDDGTLNNNHEPNCCRFDCTQPRCGDGVVDPGLGEECDGGAGCRNCRLSACGDGFLDAGEECDGTPGCTATCKLLCGNGMKNAGEECDNGDDNMWAADACRPDCTLPFCGDGWVDSGEQCDEANTADVANGCRPDCTLPTCGDDTTDRAYGEDCDDGELNSDTREGGCSTTCKRNVWRQCIDSTKTVDVSAAFPDLTRSAGVYIYDGSSSMPPCREASKWFVFAAVQPMCDAQLADYRAIFPMPSSRGVQCSAGRTVSYPAAGSVCGNCKREGAEQCDDGELNSDTRSGACRTDCSVARCGDNVVDDTLGEQCEPGVHDGCDQWCRWITACPVSRTGGCGCAAKAGCSSCASGGCSNTQQVPANSTVINVNFANMLSKATCTTCSR